jgi:hypothetical protein
LKLARFRVETTDLQGTPLTTVSAGESFQLRVYTEDLRDEPTGVFSPYLDVTYDDSLVTVVGDIEFGPSIGFPTAEPGTLNTPGVVDEVGAIVGLEATGGGELLVFSLQFVAGSQAGSVTFAGDPADVPTLHDVYFFPTAAGDLVMATPSQIDYGSATLRIESSTFAALAGSATGVGLGLLEPDHDVAADDLATTTNDANEPRSALEDDAPAVDVTALAVDAYLAQAEDDSPLSTPVSSSGPDHATTDLTLDQVLADLLDA